MLPLPDGELTQMRDTVDATIPGTAIILSPTSTADGQGGYTQAFAASGTSDARLSPLSGGEREAMERVSIIATHVLTLPADTDIDETQQVTFAEETYDVTDVQIRGTWELSRRVTVAKID